MTLKANIQGSFMSDSSESEVKSQAVSPELLEALKLAHDKHATIVHMLSTRFQFFAEEFNAVQSLISFYSALRDQVRAQVEAAEPPAPKEKAKPYIVDAVPKAETQQEGSPV